MKRASLTAYPTSPASPPADLTDRLLTGEGAPTAPQARRRRVPPRASPAPPVANAAVEPPVGESVASSLPAALAAAESAAAALRQASQQAPARYDVALRYRLDALAHHLQQVKEFVASLTSR